MTPTLSPFRRLQDATAALAACPPGDWAARDAAWDEYRAAEVASRGYVLTPREHIEMWAESIGRAHRELVVVEAAGGDTGRVLGELAAMARELMEDARAVAGKVEA